MWQIAEPMLKGGQILNYFDLDTINLYLMETSNYNI